MAKRVKRARASSIQAGHLTCRLLGHAWDRIAASRHGWAPAWGTGMVFECMRCQTERRETWNALGRLSNRSYHYADGYLMEPGIRAPKKDDIRQEYLESFTTRLRAVK